MLVKINMERVKSELIEHFADNKIPHLPCDWREERMCETKADERAYAILEIRYCPFSRQASAEGPPKKSNQ